MEPFLIFKYFIMTLTGIVLTLLMMPLILPFAILFGVICFLAQVATKILYGSTAYKADATDVIHGKVTKKCIPVINIGMKVKGELDMGKLRERIWYVITKTYNTNGERRYKRLMERYEKKFGYNIWRVTADDDFVIEDHVRELSLEELLAKSETKHSKEESRESALQNDKTVKCDWSIVMKTMLEIFDMKPFPENKPPWEMLVVKDGTDSFSILCRFHHAISDGIFLLRFFYEDLLDEPFNPFVRYEPSHPFVRILTSLGSFCLLPFGLWNIVAQNDRNPLHGPILSGRKRYYMSSRVPSDTVYTIKKSCPFRVSSHAIVFSCISYAISKHFNRRDSRVTKITVITPLPLENKTDEIKLKNKFIVGAINFPVPSIIKASDKDFPAINRLKMVQRSLEEMSKNVSILPFNILINGFCSLLPTSLAEALLSVKGCTAAISRLPGSKTELKVYGGLLNEHMFWIPDREPMGIGYGIFNYNGYLRAALTIDESLIAYEEEGSLMMEDFEDGMYNLLRELQEHKGTVTKDERNILDFIKLIP